MTLTSAQKFFPSSFLPARQLKHCVLPDFGATAPRVQAVHSDSPGLDVNLPTYRAEEGRRTTGKGG